MKRKAQYPLNAESARPLRLWNAMERKPVKYRYYSIRKHALMAALWEASLLKDVGNSIELFDTSNGKLIGQFTRTPNSVRITEPV